MPNQTNHEKMLKGLPGTFCFGSENEFPNHKDNTEATVYLGFTFSEIEDHHDHIDYEKRTFEFSIVVQYSRHLCPE